MSAPPGVILFAVRLMWSVLPFGLLVTAINAYAVYVAAQRLPTAPPAANAHAVPAALRLFEAWAWQRTLVIAAAFLVAGIVYAMLALAVRRGSRRNPAAVMVVSGALAAAFAVGCLWAYVNDPVIGFRSEWIEVPGVPGRSGVPWIMSLVVPGWYRPALAGLLGGAAAAQLLAVVMVTRTRAGVFVTGLGIAGGEDPDAVDGGTRVAARLLMAQLGIVAAYAAATAAAIRSGLPAGAEGYNGLQGSAHWTNLAVAGVIALAALPPAVHGWVMLSRRRRARPLALANTGAFSVLYLLIFWIFVDNNAASSAFFADGQSTLSAGTLAWHMPALYGLFGVAAVVQLTALVMLGRRRLPY